MLKKLSILSMLILVSTGAQAATIISGDVYHQKITGPINEAFSIAFDQPGLYYQINHVQHKITTDNLEVAFYGVDKNYNLTNQVLAAWQDGPLTITSYPGDEGGYMSGYRHEDFFNFDKYVGMKLVVSPNQETSGVYFVDESKISLLSKLDKVTYSCDWNPCRYEYAPGVLDANDIVQLGLNDFTVEYTYARYVPDNNDLPAQHSYDVPEPATMALFGLSVAGFAAMRRRQKI